MSEFSGWTIEYLIATIRKYKHELLRDDSHSGYYCKCHWCRQARAHIECAEHELILICFCPI